MLREIDVGRRVTVRFIAEVVEGRTIYTDVVGDLESWSPGAANAELTVRRRDGTSVVVPWSSVVAGRPVPWDTGSRKPPHVGYGLARVAARGWPGITVASLGDWVLQAASGFTGRANSAVPAGSPGVALDEALDHVTEFYASHGLPPLIQTIVGSPLENALTERGWKVRPSGKSEQGPWATTALQVVRLRTLTSALGPPSVPVSLDEPLDAAWFTLYGGGSLSDPARQVLAGAPSVRLARIRSDAPDLADRRDLPELAAIGRGVVTGPWLGLSAIEVVPALRRRGLGRAMMAALCEWGLAEGAVWAYLQVGTENTPALTLYERLGFATDHVYCYYTHT